MAIRVATLDGADLPLGFSYEPYIPEKRLTVTKTANAVITQAAGSDYIVHGDGVLKWTLPKAFPTEFQTLYDLYDTTGLTVYNFVGYWGETLEVMFNAMTAPKVKGGFFDISGVFQVVSVPTNYNATCTT